MKHLKTYTIPFVGLKQGEHDFEYSIDDKFFEHFEYDDFNSIDIDLKVRLNKMSTLMEFYFDAQGSINVNCDITNEPYDQPIDAAYKLVVKFGQDYNDEVEDILILPYGEYEVNIAHYIYELIVLAMPAKRIHPGVEDGTLKSDILDKLEELSIKSNQEQEDNIPEQKEIDPRWDKLKDFLTDNK
ncbi:YceD family protein [Leeuwenhoekiella sp. NPDC079379]|uniref:YceD family protein n=1 Tax=Leeuwenhoekiella sp. NPDC079379 TaxID=3364122 RepID=UPI0037C9E96A